MLKKGEVKMIHKMLKDGLKIKMEIHLICLLNLMTIQWML